MIGRPSRIALCLMLLGAAPVHATAPEQAAALFADIPRGQPGCAASVMQDGAIVWADGFGSADIAAGRPITADTVFNIASVSKQFTAFAIRLLEAEGKLKLDDSIRRYVPELGAYADPITIRMLLGHTGGLRDYIFFAGLFGIRYDQRFTGEQALAFTLAQDGAEFPAGSEFSYSNTGYFLLSVVVERLSGGTMKQFVESRILQPLGMANSSVVDRYPASIGALARGYIKDGDAVRIDESMWENTGDGQVHTTVKDIMRWIANFESGEVGGAGPVAGLLEEGHLGNGQATGYGGGLDLARYRGTRSVAHSGGWAGYNSYVFWLPELRFASAVFCNSYGLDPVGRSRRLADLYLGERLGPAGADEPPAELLAEARLGSDAVLPGTYVTPAGGVLVVERADGKLAIVEGDERLALEPADGNLLFTRAEGGATWYAAPAAGQLRAEQATLYTRLEPWQPATLAPFAGRYATPTSPGVLEIVLADGKLSTTLAGETLPLVPIGLNTFSAGDWATITFAPDGARFTSSMARGLVFSKEAP